MQSCGDLCLLESWKRRRWFGWDRHGRGSRSAGLSGINDSLEVKTCQATLKVSEKRLQVDELEKAQASPTNLHTSIKVCWTCEWLHWASFPCWRSLGQQPSSPLGERTQHSLRDHNILANLPLNMRLCWSFWFLCVQEPFTSPLANQTLPTWKWVHHASTLCLCGDPSFNARGWTWFLACSWAKHQTPIVLR